MSMVHERVMTKNPTLKDRIIVVVTIFDIAGVLMLVLGLLVVVLVVLGVGFLMVIAIAACHYAYYH